MNPTSHVTRLSRHRPKLPLERILREEVHHKKGGKTWESFLPCMIFHLLTMFQHNLGKAVKYYITKTLKKTNQVLLQQFFK
jgi:hypothetical protein